MVRSTFTLTEPERRQVADLQVRAVAADGVAPLSEQTVLNLTAGGGSVRHVLLYAAERLAGYAQVEGGEDGSAELVVDPEQRRQGWGAALLQTALEAEPAARVWAHGNLPGAQALAGRAGLAVVRELHKMSRPLTSQDAAAPVLPEGFTARAFVPGQDEQAWLATNAAAFAHHPEQGRLTLADLQDRMAQPWFDPAGFILVQDDTAPDGEVAAFHWTKVDPATPTTGEVYVVGVHPAYQGRGLGRPLTRFGLAHLAARGLDTVVLYVDGDNAAALRTYRGLGFGSIMVDVMYSRAVHPPLPR